MSQSSVGSQPIVLNTRSGPIRVWQHGPRDDTRAPPVFLQGFMAGPDAWTDTITGLASDRRCITVDWPFGAHRQALHADADASPPGVARLATEVLDRLGIERAALIGNDSGGVIAQLVVASAAQRVTAFVLISCDAFEMFPPCPYRHLFRLAAVPGVVIAMARTLSVPAFATSRFGYGAVMARRPERDDLEAPGKELNVVSDHIRDKRLAAVTVAFVVYTMVMLSLERRMRATGGPGIIPFELAGSAAQAEDIMTRWGSDGQRAARLSLWLDFGYMATYGTLTAMLVDRARRRRGHPAALPATVIAAVAADAAEGTSLLKVLKRARVAVHARRAQIAALIKFAVLASALGYVATDRFMSDVPTGNYGREPATHRTYL